MQPQGLLVDVFEVSWRVDNLAAAALHGLGDEAAHVLALALHHLDDVTNLICIFLAQILVGVRQVCVFAAVRVWTGSLITNTSNKQRTNTLPYMLYLDYDIIFYICAVIWENPAYGVTKRTGSDQTPHVLRGI